MANGFTFDSLIQSLSAAGSLSANLADLSSTGSHSKTRPLVNYADFSKHVFFGNALDKFNNSMTRIVQHYPIGLSGLSSNNSVLGTAAVGQKAIYEVDKFKQDSDGFDLYVLNYLGISGTSSGTPNSISNNIVYAVNDQDEKVPLIWIQRGAENSLTGSQTHLRESLSARARDFEELQINTVENTPGTASFVGKNLRSGSIEKVTRELSLTSEQLVNRGARLDEMLPGVLFRGDDDNILKKTLDSVADTIDEIKAFADQIPFLRRLSYDETDRIPNKLLPVLAQEYGVYLTALATNRSVGGYNIQSSSGSTYQEITYEVWNKIVNNIVYLLKTKGTKETIRTIGRIYGVDESFLKIYEYSSFYKNIDVVRKEHYSIPVLFSSGDVYVKTTSNATTGSAVAFDFPASTNFTIEMRVSATGNHSSMTLLKHPLYTIDMDASGRAAFKSTTTASMSAITDLTSLSGWIKGQGTSSNNYVNVVASRSGDTLRIWTLALSGSSSGGNDVVVWSSGATAHYDVSRINFSSTGGVGAISKGGTNYSQFPTYFPASGSFTGYMHEVRSWHDVALQNDDLFDHTRNFESVSFQNSTGSVNTVGITNIANYSSLSAHYKLRENVVLQGAYNFIVDSTTASNTAHPINFDGASGKRYVVMPNMEKIVKWSPVGLSPNNNKIRTETLSDKIIDTGYVSYGIPVIEPVNRSIKNFEQDLNIFDLLGDPEDLYRKTYTGPFTEKWHNITAQMGLAPSATFATQSSSSWNRIRSGGQQNGLDGGLAGSISGASGDTTSITDLNAFVKASDNFNDIFGGMFSFIKQFIPARSHILGEGIIIENHLLERPKMKRTFGLRESTGTGYVGAPTMSGDRGVISYDEGKTPNNQVPSLIDISVTSFTINNHYNPGNVSTQGSNSANDATLIASAATTADFQGYQYQGGIQEFLDNSVTSVRNVSSLSVQSSTNVPRFLPTRIGRALPLTIKPAAAATTTIELTTDALLISPTATPISANIGAVIKGSARMLARGNVFKTEMPALRFDFPTSGNGDNYFEATVGNIAEGRGRTIKEKDISFTTNLETGNIEFELRLSDGIRSLTAIDSARNITQNVVDITVSGSVGIVPIRITNLFNNQTTIFRVGINSDSNKDTDLIRQIQEQGGTTLQS